MGFSWESDKFQENISLNYSVKGLMCFFRKILITADMVF